MLLDADHEVVAVPAAGRVLPSGMVSASSESDQDVPDAAHVGTEGHVAPDLQGGALEQGRGSRGEPDVELVDQRVVPVEVDPGSRRSDWAITSNASPKPYRSDLRQQQLVGGLHGTEPARGTCIARDPSNTSTAAPMAVSIWMTSVETLPTGPRSCG